MDIAAISGGLSSLVLLACPIGMGLMMWMMMRGKKKDPAQQNSDATHAGRPASIEVLREEQRRLGEEIGRLEGEPATKHDVGAKSP